MPNLARNVAPVAGQVIPMSMKMIVAGIAMYLLSLTLGWAYIGAWWWEIDIPWPPWGDRNRRFDAMSGVFVVAATILFLPMIILYLRGRERLILGADRL